MEIPISSYRKKSPQSSASVESKSIDIDIVDLCTDHEQFDLEVDAGRINLEDIKQEPSISAARDSDNNRINDRSSPSTRTSKRNTPTRGRKRRSHSSFLSRSSISSSSSSESSSSSSESDEPYFLDKKREKDRVRKLKRYRKTIRQSRRHSRERRSHSRERKRSSEIRNNEQRGSRRRSTSEQQRIIIVPMLDHPYMHQAAQMMPYMPYFHQQMIPPPEFHGPMQMSQIHQMPRLSMAPFMGPGSSMPPHAGFQSMPFNRKSPNLQSFHWKKWKKQKKQKQQNNSRNHTNQPNQTSPQNQKQ